jgi:hypothetical protein
MSIGDFCVKFNIPNEVWKAIVRTIVRHLLMEDLFPNKESNLVPNILDSFHLHHKDTDGDISYKVDLSYGLIALIMNNS